MQAKKLEIFQCKANKNNSRLVKINNRFGEVEVDPAKKILFPHGLLGLHDHHSFALCEHNVKGLTALKLLQSLEDDCVAIMVMALEKENPLINIEDVYEACITIGYNPESLVMLLVASTRQGQTGKSEVILNIRAPIMVDVDDFFATQFVFKNDAYLLQMPFTEALKYFIP